MADNKNEAIRLLEEILKTNKQLVSFFKAQGHKPAGTLHEKPTLDSVLSFAREIFCENEIAEIWFYSCEGTGWQMNGSPIVNWKGALRAYAKTCARNDRSNDPEPVVNHSKMDKSTISEMDRSRWIKDNRKQWQEAGYLDDISELVATE